MRTASPRTVSDYLISAFVAGGLALVLATVPTGVSAQQLPQSCADNKGRWLERFNECESVSEQWCHSAGGQFVECGSACRHESGPVPCTMQCVPVCTFAAPLVQNTAKGTRDIDSKSGTADGDQAGDSKERGYVPDSRPQLFSYDELVQLSLNWPMSPELTQKLRTFTTTPFIYSKPSRELSDTVRTYSQQESNASVAESIDEACRRVALR